MYRLLVADIDGTLLGPTHRIEPEAFQAVSLARANGLEVTLATGRAYPATLWVAKALGIVAPFVCAGGATICDTQGRVWRDLTLGPVVIREVIASLPAEVDVVAFTHQKAFASSASESVNRYSSALGMEFEVTCPLIVADQGVRVLAVRGKPEVIGALSQQLMQGYSDVAEVERVLPHMVEIRAKGASKRDGLHHLVQVLEVPMEEVIAVGDGLGDVGMVASAGFGVAVANSCEPLKACARYVARNPHYLGVLEAVKLLCAS
ncbi:MAG: HAD family hydrolase [Bacillota bacterium]